MFFSRQDWRCEICVVYGPPICVVYGPPIQRCHSMGAASRSIEQLALTWFEIIHALQLKTKLCMQPSVPPPCPLPSVVYLPRSLCCSPCLELSFYWRTRSIFCAPNIAKPFASGLAIEWVQNITHTTFSAIQSPYALIGPASCLIQYTSSMQHASGMMRLSAYIQICRAPLTNSHTQPF